MRVEIMAIYLTRIFLYPAAMFLSALFLMLAGNRITNKIFHAFASVLASSAAFAFIFYRGVPGSVAVSHLTLAFVMTAVVFILNFVKLKALDYAVFFACFSCLARFVTLDNAVFGSALPMAYVFVIVLTVYKIRLNRLDGHLFHVWFTVILSFSSGYVFYHLLSYNIAQIGYAFGTGAEKIIVWGIAAALVCLINAAAITAIKRIFGKLITEINDMGRRYPRIERYFIYNSAVILLAASIICVFGAVRTGIPDAAVNFMIAAAFIVQLSFLILIFRITRLRDDLTGKTLESSSLAEYSSDLEKNMDDIRGIKHDIKNIFITMGNFVEESGNDAMKDFFRERIGPFVNGEIAKSDAFARLAAIKSEHLKAFLYYKASRAAEMEIKFELEIKEDFSPGPDIELTDLIRILGILIDNAIEECAELPEKPAVSIRLAQNDEMDTYAIKNPVRAERLETGIKPGISTKTGSGERGKGLMIVNKIANNYENVVLNSYFKDGCFAQSLVVQKINSFPSSR